MKFFKMLRNLFNSGNTAALPNCNAVVGTVRKIDRL